MKVITALLALALCMPLVASEKKEESAPQVKTTAQIKTEKRRNLALLCIKGAGVLACAWALWGTTKGGYESVNALMTDPNKVRGADAAETNQLREALLKKKAESKKTIIYCPVVVTALVYWGKHLALQLKDHFKKATQKVAPEESETDEFESE